MRTSIIIVALLGLVGGCEQGAGASSSNEALSPAAHEDEGVDQGDDSMMPANYPASVHRAIALDSECRGGRHDADDAVCTARNKAFDDLNRKGWCHGRPGDYGADRYWHKCVETGFGHLPLRQMRTVEQCAKAVRLGVPEFPEVTVTTGITFAQNNAPDPQVDISTEAGWRRYEELTKNRFDLRIRIPFSGDEGGKKRDYTAICEFKDMSAEDQSLRLISSRIVAD